MYPARGKTTESLIPRGLTHPIPSLIPACQSNFSCLVVVVQLLPREFDSWRPLPHPPSCRHVRAALGTAPLQPRLSPSCRDGDISGHGRGIMPGTCRPLPTRANLRPCQHPLHIWICRDCVTPISLSTNLYFWTVCHCGPGLEVVVASQYS